MKSRLSLTVGAVFWMLSIPSIRAQATPVERGFPESKAVVEAAVHQVQASAAGHLPLLDGFTLPGEQPLDRFQKGYYQCTVQVNATPTGGSVVRVTAKITAWYNAPEAAKSGYQVLPSNGRLESDLLDRLADALAAKTPAGTASAKVPNTLKAKDGTAGSVSTRADLPPAPSFKGNAFPQAEHIPAPPPRTGAVDQRTAELEKEAKSLQEILHNQSHPENLAAVRKSGTPVLTNPSEGAKVLFLADAEDEFEILDSNESWVHVRISGLSRAWIRRSNLEMPGSSGEAAASVEAPPAPAPASDKTPFQIENEQTASFPGDWAPLRGKVVRIVSIQKTPSSGTESSPPANLAFVKGLFDKEYSDLAQASSEAAGIVLIFDFAEGGMVAATLPVLREWKAGVLSDDGFWRRCYFDPPEMFHAAGQ